MTYKYKKPLHDPVIIPKDEDLTVLVIKVVDNDKGFGFAYSLEEIAKNDIRFKFSQADRRRYKHRKIYHKKGDKILANVNEGPKGYYTSYFRPYNEKPK